MLTDKELAENPLFPEILVDVEDIACILYDYIREYEEDALYEAACNRYSHYEDRCGCRKDNRERVDEVMWRRAYAQATNELKHIAKRKGYEL